MPLGDGGLVRAGMDALVELLRHFASPTGARGSVLLMMGGLVVLGFLFLAFIFRSAIVGDLAPVANARARLPRVRLPGDRVAPPDEAPPPDFSAARRAARHRPPSLDGAIDALLSHGSDARFVGADATRKVVRLYRCASCARGLGSCDGERGTLAGSFEAMTGQLAKVDEVACVRSGAPYCTFEVRHAAILPRRR